MRKGCGRKKAPEGMDGGGVINECGREQALQIFGGRPDSIDYMDMAGEA